MALSLLLRSSARLPGKHGFQRLLKPTWFNRKFGCIIVVPKLLLMLEIFWNYSVLALGNVSRISCITATQPSVWMNKQSMNVSWSLPQKVPKVLKFQTFLERSSDLSFSNPPISIRKSCRIVASWACSFDWHAWNCSSRSRLSISNRRLPSCCVPCNALSLGIGSNRDGLYPRKCFRQCSTKSCSWSPSSVLSCNSCRSLYDGLQGPRFRQNRQKDLGYGKQMN